MEFGLRCELSDTKFMQMKRILISILLSLIVVSCTSRRDASVTTPELTTDHITGWVVYSKSVSSEPYIVQIFLKNLDTGEVTQLTHSELNRDPRWSPDGSKIVFASFTKENAFDIYIMNKDGSGQTPIVSTSADEYMPDWSPDGKQVLFSSFIQGEPAEIYLLDTTSKNTKKLTSTFMDHYAPAWSVDGKQIAFAFGGAGSRTQIYTMNNEGVDIKQVTNYDFGEFNDSPVWCPDDTCIVFGGGKSGSQLMLLDLNSQTATPLLGNVFKPGALQIGPSRSPVRGFITFLIDKSSYAMDLETKKIYSLGITDALDISLYP